MSFQKDYAEETVCMEDCAFADEAGECLIRQALQCYVSAARTQTVNKIAGKTRKLQGQCNFRPPAIRK